MLRSRASDGPGAVVADGAVAVGHVALRREVQPKGLATRPLTRADRPNRLPYVLTVRRWIDLKLRRLKLLVISLFLMLPLPRGLLAQVSPASERGLAPVPFGPGERMTYS